MNHLRKKEQLGWWLDEGDIPSDEIGDLGIMRRHKLKMLTDRHQAFFAYRRAMVHGVEHPEWFAEPELGSLVNRIKEDIAEVDSFIQAKFSGPQSLALPAPDGPSGAGPSEPFLVAADRHIDILNVTQANTDPPAHQRRDNQIAFRQFREDAARGIIWRAAALHGGYNGTLQPEDHWSLWDNTKSQGERLKKTDLTTILDRRLRMVERMRFQINYVTDPGMRANVTRAPGGGRTGPWQDFVRVQIFQYPFLFRGPASLALITPVNPEQWETNQDEYDWAWRPDPAQSRKIPTKLFPEPSSVSTIWTPSNKDYAYKRTFTGSDLANGMDELMESHLDYFRRPWLYCDQVCCALHLDALRFALLRKNGDANAQFNAIPAVKGAFLEVPLGAAPVNTDRPDAGRDGSLFHDGHGQSAEWFENRFIPIHDLQIGDHSIFYNHQVYLALWGGAFRLENAVVTDLDSNPWPEKTGVEYLKIKLEGHGMPARDVAGFQTDMLSSINATGEVGGLGRSRQDAHRAEAEGLDVFINWRGYLLLKWTPYPGITPAPGAAGPWFIYLARIDQFDVIRWPNIDRMLEAVSYSVLKDPAPSAGYTGNPLPRTAQARLLTEPGEPVPPLRSFALPADSGVLFPLYLPYAGATRLTWRQYFDLRRNNPALQVTLRPYNAPREIIPGFFIAGRTPFPAQVLRPKAHT